MNIFISLILSAILVETIVTYITAVVEDHQINWKMALSMGIAIFFAIVYGIDLLSLLGLNATSPVVGMILTGILISRGSNGIYDLLRKIGEAQSGEEGINE